MFYKKKQHFIRVLIIAGIAAAATLINNFFIENTTLNTRLKESGIAGMADFDNPIIAGIVYCNVALIGLFIILRFPQNKTMKPLITTSIFLCIITGIFSLSRTPFVGVIQALTGLTVIYPKSNVKWWLLGIFVILIGITTTPLLDTFITRSGTSRRPQIWFGAIKHITQDAPLLGFGAGNDVQFTAQKIVNGKVLSGSWSHPHNGFILIASQAGLIGLSVYLALFNTCIKGLILNRESQIAPLALSLVLFSIGIQITDPYTIISRPGPLWLAIWFPFGIALSTLGNHKKT